MTFIPAIDILGGECVRLQQGNYSEVTVYDTDPVTMARSFEEAGATRIPIVDLDAAREGRGVNRKKIRKIRKAVSCTLELGGGIRSEDDVEELLDLGIDRLVLGTVFARKPDRVHGWTAHYGSVFIAGIDAYDGKVRVAGWEADVPVSDTDLAKKAKEIGMASIIYTNIARDGMLEGPDLERTNAIAEASGLPVIVSGGLSSVTDLDRIIAEGHARIVGVIAGKSVYDGRIKLDEAFARCTGDTRNYTGEW